MIAQLVLTASLLGSQGNPAITLSKKIASNTSINQKAKAKQAPKITVKYTYNKNSKNSIKVSVKKFLDVKPKKSA